MLHKYMISNLMPFCPFILLIVCQWAYFDNSKNNMNTVWMYNAQIPIAIDCILNLFHTNPDILYEEEQN